MSLRLRLVFSTALVLLATLLIGSVLIYWHGVTKVDREMRAAAAVGSLIAQNTAADLNPALDPRRHLERLVSDFDGDRHLRATLLDLNGKVLRVSKVQRPDVRPSTLLVWLFNRPAHRIDVELPAVLAEQGRIYLETAPSNEIAEVGEDVRLYLGLLAALNALVLLVTVATVGRVLAPLKRLQGAFAQIGKGDYSARVAASGPPEFVKLYDDFNDMSRRLQTMNEETRRLSQQLERVQQEERADLARDLHDDLSPLVFSIDVDATIIRKTAAGGDVQRLEERADAIRDAVANVKRQVKSILGLLRPTIALEFGLLPLLDAMADRWRARHKNVVFEIRADSMTYGSTLDSTLYHLVRESVSNALRHGQPRRIGVSVLKNGDRVILEVSDDGGGMAAPGRTDGFGITGMRERTAQHGGLLTLTERTDTAGVTVRAELPIAGAERNGQLAVEAGAAA